MFHFFVVVVLSLRKEMFCKLELKERKEEKGRKGGKEEGGKERKKKGQFYDEELESQRD